MPNANYGPVLVPKEQGFPSTIAWVHAAWTGEHFKEHVAAIPPQWYISPIDCALLHISALIHSDVDGERIFGFAERWSYNQILAIFRKTNPDKTFPDDVEDQGEDRVTPPRERSEEVLKWVKGSGWTSLEESIAAMTREW